VRLLVLTDRLAPLGGAEVHLLSVLRELARRHDLVVAAGQIASGPDAVVAAPVVRIRGLAATGARARPGVLAKIRRLLASVRPEIVHMQNVLCPEVIDAVVAAAPTVITVQDHRVFCPGMGKLTPEGEACRLAMDPGICAACLPDPVRLDEMLSLTRARLDAARRARALVVLSEYMRGELALLGCDASRLHVVPPFPDLEAPPPAGPAKPGPPLVVMSGRLVRAKGTLVLVEAAALLARPAAGPEGRLSASGRLPVRLVVAGDGPGRAEMQERARARGVALDVRGWLARRDLAALVAGARMLVMPGLWQEPFGLSGLEAQSLGVPVVASDGGGVREWLVPGRTGFLVTRGRPDELAARIDELASDAALAHRMGRQARAVARRFARAALMARLEAVYAGASASSRSADRQPDSMQSGIPTPR
jgi:glycosyltransferase involved in cell wall biosynthesis